MMVMMNDSLPAGTGLGEHGMTGRTSTANAWSPPVASTADRRWSADTPLGHFHDHNQREMPHEHRLADGVDVPVELGDRAADSRNDARAVFRHNVQDIPVATIPGRRLLVLRIRNGGTPPCRHIVSR